MNHQQREKLDELKAFLDAATTSYTETVDEKIGNEDWAWNASLFLAKAIRLAQPLELSCSITSFEQFRLQFEADNSIQVDTQGLFDRFWLRTVLGCVEISGTVSAAIRSFDDISDYREELQFLSEFMEQRKESKSFQKEDLEAAIEGYEKEHNTRLNKEGVYFKKWFSEVDGKINIPDIKFYFGPYLKCWSDFQFLSAFRKQRKDYSNGLLIDAVKLEALHLTFSSFFLDTPSLDTLERQKLLVKKDGFYILNFWNSKVKYWSNLKSQIAGRYWQILLDDDEIFDDKDRIKNFLELMFYWEGHPDPLSYVSINARTRFLDAALELILAQVDLVGVEQEFGRVSVDQSFGADWYSLFHPPVEHIFELNNSDFFELLESLNSWKKSASVSYLHEQVSRGRISYLIALIVRHDDEFPENTVNDVGGNKGNFWRVFSLLSVSLDRPFILWETTRWVIAWRRNLVCYLLVDSSFLAVAFQLFEEFTYRFKDKADLSVKLWVKAVELALLTIRLDVGEAGDRSPLVFQIYRALNQEKYRFENNARSRGSKENLKTHIAREDAVLSVIENCPLYTHIAQGGSDEYLLPSLAEFLADDVGKFFEKKVYDNGVVQFPMMQWDALAWLMKCSTYWKYRSQLKPGLQNSLASSFFKLYMARIEILEVERYNYFENKRESTLPHWAEGISRLSLINWVYPIYFIDRFQLLGSFLAPRFIFDATAEFYHRRNQFVASKLRTHLGVLIQVFKKLVSPSVPHGLKRDNLLRIKVDIERQIIGYLERHIVDVPEEGRIDLFDFNLEWRFATTDAEALLPQIAAAINWFQERTAIINALTRSQDIIKLLIVAQEITSEGVRVELLDQIRQTDLTKFLKSVRGVPTVNVVMEIRKYPELVDQIGEVVDLWKNGKGTKKVEEQIQLYQTELMLAYFRSDESGIVNSNVPDIQSGILGSNRLSPTDLKEFFIALFFIKKMPQRAYKIFTNLARRYPHFSNLAVNRLAAAINVAQELNKAELYEQALEEWEDYSRRFKAEEEIFDSALYVNKMEILSKLARYENLDETYRALDLPLRMLPDILVVKIDSLIVRGKVEEALAILDEADSYHLFSASKKQEFINELRRKVNGVDNVEELRRYFLTILNSSPERVVRIVPERFNGRTDIVEFIVNEVVIAASRMLDKINALPDIINNLRNNSKENRFNDLLELALESRISMLGWSVKPQNRKGFSEEGKDLGQIDLDVKDSNQITLITLESFILRDSVRVESHLFKLISNYTHQKNAVLLVVFYQEEHQKFEKAWIKYRTQTLVNLAYPKGYELDGVVLELTEEFACEHSGIRVGRSNLKSGTRLFHVFVSVCYVLNKLK